jgi:hypothetical protein
MKTDVDILSCEWWVANKMKVHKLCIVDGHGGERLWQGVNQLPSSWTWFIDPSQWAWFDTYGLLFIICMQS